MTSRRAAPATTTLETLLPLPAHAPRLPPHVGAAEIDRLRRAAHALPQIVQPDDEGADAEARLDAAGLVLLQAAAGARRSRWIAPAAVDAALAHIEAVGAGSGARAEMLDRAAALQPLGLGRRDGTWTRRGTAALALSAIGWTIPVTFEAPLADAGPVWAYFRDGDFGALEAALGAPPPYPHAAALRAHLDTLVERSRADRPRHLASLQPRLQSACAAPLDPAALLAACTRAQERWARAADDLDAIEGLHSELAFDGYPASFAQARRLQRRVTLYVGPPNSGKTHAAFDRLEQAGSGAYLAPLRLLALEGRDRLVARGVPCSLLTGEENVPAAGARVVSSTIEMVDTRATIDVAVIDEAQMLFDAARGWAWTQAIVGVPAREVVVICSAYAVAAIETLLGACGERCSVRRFDRMQHVELLPRPVPMGALRLGDAVVAFSRRDVLLLRDAIAADGHPVAVIYGALPPEVRRREAERYAEGQAHVLVATDAIGMGLNLPIRRVLFSTMNKFDGQVDRPLDTAEVHQIAGRAGRYGLHEEGHAGVLDDAEPGALRALRDALARTPQAPPDFKAPVAPNAWHVETIARRLAIERLSQVLAVFMQQLRLDDAHFAVAALEQMTDLARRLDDAAARLTLHERFVYAQAPVDLRSDDQVEAFVEWAASHAARGRAGRPWFLDAVDGHSRLEKMEQALRACTLWLWLDLRFAGVYGHLDDVLALRSALNDGIERQLGSKRPLARLRGRRRG